MLAKTADLESVREQDAGASIANGQADDSNLAPRAHKRKQQTRQSTAVTLRGAAQYLVKTVADAVPVNEKSPNR